MKNFLNKIIIFIALFVGMAHGAMPSWWPASRGFVVEGDKELAEVDRELAEIDQKLLEFDQNLTEMLEFNDEFKAYVPTLRTINKYNNDEILKMLELTQARVNQKNELIKNMNQASSTIMGFINAISGGNADLIAMILAMLGLGGVGYGGVKGRTAKTMESKAIKFAFMGEESKEEIKRDKCFKHIAT